VTDSASQDGWAVPEGQLSTMADILLRRSIHGGFRPSGDILALKL
jgi:hypothetical protein